MSGQRIAALGVLLAAIVGLTAVQMLLREGGSVAPGPASAASASGPGSSTERSPTAVAGAATPGAPPTGAAPTRLVATTAAPVAPARPAPTATPVAPTPTPLPPTPTPRPAGPVKTGPGQVPAVGAAYIAVVDQDSGQLLYDKGAHVRTPPASLTKIATAIVALERGNPQERVTVDFDPTELWGTDSTLAGLYVGDQQTLEDLLYGLMLPSGNDAALAIAQHVGGSKARFVQMMNDKVAELGLKDTQFKNPHGLHEEGHYTSAHDITMLARYGMQRYPLFAKLASATSHEMRGSRVYTVYNLNKFLWNYEGADGVKVGYTDEAGKTIVASATRGGHRVLIGLMRYTNIVGDTVPLFDYVFNNYTWP